MRQTTHVRVQPINCSSLGQGVIVRTRKMWSWKKECDASTTRSLDSSRAPQWLLHSFLSSEWQCWRRMYLNKHSNPTNSAESGLCGLSCVLTKQRARETNMCCGQDYNCGSLSPFIVWQNSVCCSICAVRHLLGMIFASWLQIAA